MRGCCSIYINGDDGLFHQSKNCLPYNGTEQTFSSGAGAINSIEQPEELAQELTQIIKLAICPSNAKHVTLTTLLFIVLGLVIFVGLVALPFIYLKCHSKTTDEKKRLLLRSPIAQSAVCGSGPVLLISEGNERPANNN